MTQARSDFVVALTLAEVFLLFLFVIWAAHASETDPENMDPERIRVQLMECKTALRVAEESAAELSATVEILRSELYRIRIAVGADASDADTLLLKVRERIDEARRGKPKCAEDNVLVEADVLRGQERLRPRGALFLLAEPGESVPTSGSELTSADQIDQFLAAVRGYYGRTAQRCRFDYVLKYSTDADYKAGRERFERLFYPAAIRPVEQ